MAKIYEPSAEEIAGWNEWVASRPDVVKAVAGKFQPWELYRLKSSYHRVVVNSFYEDGTLSVIVSGRFNLVVFDRKVFGISPDDLEPCELPAPGEMLGAAMTPNQVEDNIDSLRVTMRPDLWTMGDDGKAVRKQ